MPLADEASAAPGEIFHRGTLRGTEGFFRVGQDAAGGWWLVEPSGTRFFARCVQGVKAATPQGDGALPPDPGARLRAWGFNAIGVGGAEGAGRDDGWPFLATVDFCATGRLISGGRLRLPDVFDPEWQRLAAERALEVCAGWIGSRELIGWATDSRLEWALTTHAGRPSLLQLCLSLEPSFPAYHAAWEFVLALHGGQIDALAHAWGVPIANKEVVREMTRGEQGLGTRGYLRDEARWAREFARRYFTTTSSAVRAADPNHLVLGCRFGGVVGAAVLGECVYPAVDVAMPHWAELPSPAAKPSHPVLAGEVSWVGEEFLRPQGGDRASRLTTVERMLRRARIALDRLARHPAVVGYAWSRWEDEPGERAPFAGGLVHTDGTEAREHTELLADFNARVEALRRGTGRLG